MSTVQGHNEVRSQPFGEYCDRRVCSAEREVAVFLDQSRDPIPFFNCRRFYLNRREAAKERGFCCWTEAFTDQIRNFGDNERRDDEVQIVSPEDLTATLMLLIIFVNSGVKRAGVNDGDQ